MGELCPKCKSDLIDVGTMTFTNDDRLIFDETKGFCFDCMKEFEITTKKQEVKDE